GREHARTGKHLPRRAPPGRGAGGRVTFVREATVVAPESGRDGGCRDAYGDCSRAALVGVLLRRGEAVERPGTVGRGVGSGGLRGGRVDRVPRGGRPRGRQRRRVPGLAGRARPCPGAVASPPPRPLKGFG